MDVVTLDETMVRFSPPLGESLESAPVLPADLGGAESNVAVTLARLGSPAVGSHVARKTPSASASRARSVATA